MRHSIITICFFIFTAFKSNAQDVFDSPQWQTLKERLADKSIIALGEPGHGYESVNYAKSMVAARLQSEMGCKAIAFESSFTAGMIAYLNHDSLEIRLRKFLYPFWNTPSVVSAMKAFATSEQTNDQPRIVGFDIQEDCRFKCLSDYLLKAGVINTTRTSLLESDSILAYYIGKDFSRRGPMQDAEYKKLLNNYDQVMLEIESQQMTPKRKKLLLRTIENRKWLCKYLTLSTANDKMYYRDSLMAENIIWLKRELFSNEKLILWAAELHIAKPKQGATPKWMGDWLVQKFPGSYFNCAFRKEYAKVRKERDKKFSLRLYPDAISRFDAEIYLERLDKITSAQWITPCD